MLCPNCYSKETDLITSTGKGKIYTYTVYHQAFDKAFEKDIPYVVAIIELEEGPHLLSNIVNYNADELGCDVPVTVVWEDIDNDFVLPKFKITAALKLSGQPV